MSEQVDMVEVKTEPNESVDLFSVCNNTDMVANHTRHVEFTSESKDHSSVILKLNFKYRFILNFFITSF